METFPGRGGRRSHRPLRGRASALALAAVLGLVLVLLASAVFSIAGRSRDVASRSVALHALNESLRAATSVRAQIAFAAYLHEADGVYGTDSKGAITASVREAQGSLAELDAASSTLPAQALDRETSAALARFTRDARRALRVISGGRPVDASSGVADQMVHSFSAAHERLASRRNDALADVKAAGSLLGRLGGLASFVIAFVLPTVAVLVYRQITRRTRESTHLATALARERGRADRRRKLLILRLTDMRRELAETEALASDPLPPAVSRLGWDLDALITVIGDRHLLAFAEVDLAAGLADVGEALQGAGVDVRLGTVSGAAWSDPRVLSSVLAQLVLEARASGAREVTLEAAPGSGERVAITVTHDGAALTPHVTALIFDRAHDAERASVEAGAAPIRLLAAQRSLEAMEGSLAPLPVPGRPGYVVHLPRPAGRAVDDRDGRVDLASAPA